MSVRNLLLLVVGILFALWMSVGRWAFGVGGDLTWWYLWGIALPYALILIFTLNRMSVAEERGREIPRKVFGSLVLSWVCALAFGLTVPDLIDGELVTITSHWWGEGWIGMSIALCNPFGIIAFVMLFAAMTFAILAGRDPRPSEDDLLDAAEEVDAAEAADGSPQAWGGQ